MSCSDCIEVNMKYVYISSLLLMFVRVYVAFNNFSVISQWCLATGSSMLTFIVLSHWIIMPQTPDMIQHPVTLSWHWVSQSLLYSISLSAKRGAASTIFNDFGMSQPGIEPVTSHSPEWTLSTDFRGIFFFFFLILSYYMELKKHDHNRTTFAIPAGENPVFLSAFIWSQNRAPIPKSILFHNCCQNENFQLKNLHYKIQQNH